MSTQPPERFEGVNNPENVTGTKKYFLRSRAHGDEESLHEESSTRSPSPSPDSRDHRIMELEENVRQLKAKNARYHSRLAAKQPMRDTTIPTGILRTSTRKAATLIMRVLVSRRISRLLSRRTGNSPPCLKPVRRIPYPEQAMRRQLLKRGIPDAQPSTD